MNVNEAALAEEREACIGWKAINALVLRERNYGQSPWQDIQTPQSRTILARSQPLPPGISDFCFRVNFVIKKKNVKIPRILFHVGCWYKQMINSLIDVQRWWEARNGWEKENSEMTNHNWFFGSQNSRPQSHQRKMWAHVFFSLHEPTKNINGNVIAINKLTQAA
jgi:hypothetical protein